MGGDRALTDDALKTGIRAAAFWTAFLAQIWVFFCFLGGRGLNAPPSSFLLVRGYGLLARWWVCADFVATYKKQAVFTCKIFLLFAFRLNFWHFWDSWGWSEWLLKLYMSKCSLLFGAKSGYYKLDTLCKYLFINMLSFCLVL